MHQFFSLFLISHHYTISTWSIIFRFLIWCCPLSTTLSYSFLFQFRHLTFKDNNYQVELPPPSHKSATFSFSFRTTSVTVLWKLPRRRGLVPIWGPSSPPGRGWIVKLRPLHKPGDYGLPSEHLGPLRAPLSLPFSLLHVVPQRKGASNPRWRPYCSLKMAVILFSLDGGHIVLSRWRSYCFLDFPVYRTSVCYRIQYGVHTVHRAPPV